MKRLILCTMLTALSACAKAHSQTSDDQTVKSRSNSEMADWLSAFNTQPGPGASYSIVKNGQAIESAGFGLADLGSGLAITHATPMRTGSVGKTFTALAIAITQERGLLNYDDPITNYLDTLPSWLDKVTIRHLLTHTSGLPGWEHGYTQDLCPLESDSRITNSEVIDWLGSRPESRLVEPGSQTIDPGLRFKYSNTGFVLLASIVEVANGVTFPEFLKANIFQPAGLTAYVVSSDRETIPGRPSAYGDYPFFENMTDYRQGCNGVNGDGGIFISADDFTKYMLALENNLLVTEETKQVMFTKSKLNDGSDNQVGFAWFIDEFGGQKVINHEGGWGGFSSYIAYFPDANLWFSFSTNYIGLRHMFESDISKLLERLVPYMQ